MKKNLISAVAAGLALALAITSFGCESGNDNPVHYAYTRDRYGYDPAAAADAGDVFTYIAKPTNVYFNNVKYASGLVGAVYAFPSTTQDKYTGYTLSPEGGRTYVNGVQAYNVSKGTFDTEGKDPDYTLEAGKVVNTWTETISFDPATGTFEYYDEKTEFNVIEYVFCTDTEWAGSLGDTGVEGKAGKEHIEKNATIDSLDKLVDHASNPDELILYKAMRDGMKYKVYKKDTYKGVKVFETTQYVNADGDVLYEETTTDIDPNDPTFHYAPIATGTFEITGNFKVGTILITGWDDGLTYKVFNDKKGTYAEFESNPLLLTSAEYQNFTDGKDIEKDFPEKSTTTHTAGYVDTASEFCKTGRTLEIADLVVKTKKIKTDTTTGEAGYTFTSLLLTQDPKFNADGYYDYNAVSCNYILQD